MQRQEHAELQARHEQLQHALRQHEQVIDSLPVALQACAVSLHGHDCSMKPLSPDHDSWYLSCSRQRAL